MYLLISIEAMYVAVMNVSLAIVLMKTEKTLYSNRVWTRALATR